MSETNEIIRDEIIHETSPEPSNECNLLCNNDLEMEMKATKRERNEDESDWIEIKRHEKRAREEEKIELYISSNDKMPKQFSLARLFKDKGIKGITRVKYINPYRVRVDLQNYISADLLENCKEFLDKGWRFQRAMENNFSYGVIKNIDVDISENCILEHITCQEPAKIISVNRLNRRDLNETGWSPSEAVRLCFKGSYIPPYVYIHDTRVKVETYVFPVSQCSRCWKFGHSYKKCPSNQIVCPKCAKNHANCEIESYCCVNCKGNHMALSKICPFFRREKQIRNIMAEFNCTYRKAITVYVPPNERSDDSGRQDVVCNDTFEFPKLQVMETTSTYDLRFTPTQVDNPRTYAEKVKTKAVIHHQPPRKTSNSSNKKQQEDTNNMESEVKYPNNRDYEELKTKTKVIGADSKRISFDELLSRLKEIIFFNQSDIQSKIKNVLKCCIEWLILLVVDNVADWPVLKFILDYFKYNG